MSPVEIAAETDRLWSQVKPLYEQLHCYTRTRLTARYGDKAEVAGGMLPAHLLGNMWQQDWRSEEHTSELQSLMRISYAVFCLKKKNTHNKQEHMYTTIA